MTTPSPESQEMILLLHDWIESGELGNYEVNWTGDFSIVFFLKDMLRYKSGAFEIKLGKGLIATVWYKTDVIGEWDLHDAKQFEALGEVFSRHGNDGTDPKSLIGLRSKNNSS